MIVNPCILQDMIYYHNRADDIDINAVGCELSEWEADEIAKAVLPRSIVLNTCAVTENSQKASILVAKMLKKIYPDRNLFICGCGINYNEEDYKELGAILLPNEKKDNKGFYENKVTRNPDEVAYIKVQEGCNNHCAYCVVNKLRPVLKSFPYERIKSQIIDYLNNGKCDFQIIGTEICLYNSDDLTIDTLCEKILKDFPEIKTLSLNALNPSSRKIEKIIDLMNKDTRLQKQLYISVQSGSNIILNRMHRAYDKGRIKEICNYDKEVKTYWDLVCGFPGETEEQFQETVELIKELQPEELMICPYSDRNGTESSTLPDHLSCEEIMKRANILKSLVKKTEHRALKTEGSEIVLDLYDDEEVARFCRENNSSDIVIYTPYRGIDDNFEVNLKMISVRFQVRFVFMNKTNKSIENQEEFLEYYNGNKII